jgi:alpha(1,3/1,4) fucosyltransferase
MIRTIAFTSILLYVFTSLSTPEFEKQATNKTIYITSGQWGNLFDITNPFLNSDDQRQPTHQLRLALNKMGYSVKQADSITNLKDVALLITFDIPPFHQLKDKLIAFLWEPPSTVPHNYDTSYHNYFSRIYTWNDSMVDGALYHKFYYPAFNTMIDNPIDFHQKKFCTLIASNKYSPHPDELYSARKDAISFFQQNTASFQFYGYNWDASKWSSYRGPIARKLDVLKQYKFCICYENIKNVPGYITEKIFDCFRAGCVPIYWGAPNVELSIPKNCYIDRQCFSNNSDLFQFLCTVDEQTYQNYLDAIKIFLSSEQAKLYSIEHFIAIFKHLVLNHIL